MSSMLPPTIPIFPLPNVVLFPNVFLPLHIFEPRYREMVRGALATDRIIGMVLLRPGYERDYEGRPPVYPVGCAGVITHSEVLPDGRFNIILKGIEKFKMTGEDTSRSYRLAHVEAVPDAATDAGARGNRALPASARRPGASATEHGRQEPKLPQAGLIRISSTRWRSISFDPLERQALLECNGVLSRC